MNLQLFRIFLLNFSCVIELPARPILVYKTIRDPKLHSRYFRLFRVECGRADPARVLGIDVEVLDDERTLTSAHSKDLDNAPSYVPLLDISGPLQPL